MPGGPWPHPVSSPDGHLAGRPPRAVPPIDPARWPDSAAYREGFTLFDAGYYWEAHEVWEGLWHAHGRAGPIANLLRGLIKLAAAGVKVRERQPAGVTTHARRAAAIFRELRRQVGNDYLGLNLESLIAFAEEVASSPPTDPGPTGARVSRVFATDLAPRRSAIAAESSSES